MKYISMIAIVGICAAAIGGCSQAQFESTWNYGAQGRITCYSGGKVISDDYSTGRIESESHSDGWKYVSATDRGLKHASGQCVLQQRTAGPPKDFKPVYP